MTQPDYSDNPYIWATLLTNSSYLEGVLTLNYSLIKVNSIYPLVVLYTDQLDLNSIEILIKNKIKILKIDKLLPILNNKNLKFEKRFLDTWSKLYFFKLIQFKRIIQLDSDMLILKNFDELMTLPLGNYSFSSTHACVCNPLKKKHYPSNWIPSNCVYSQSNYNNNNENNHNQILGPSSKLGLSECNSGLLIVEPSLDSFNLILNSLNDENKTKNYLFPDQDLLSDVFYQNWLSISHNYNCLKTFKLIHPEIWDLSKIKIIHYILSPKPWNVDPLTYIDDSNTFHLWWNENNERLKNSTI